MIEYKIGNIINEDTEALVNTVNCVGIMGRGIALQFKNAFPGMFKDYQRACKEGRVNPGRMYVYDTQQLTNPRYIINFPTKRHWRGKSRIEDIDQGLDALVNEIEKLGITSIAIPPLGSGLGGLNWNKVRPKIESALNKFDDLSVVIFEPGEASEERVNRSTKVPKMTKGRASLIQLINRYILGLLDPYATLLEVHKLMYFMQAAGEPLKLKYVKGEYGPYAENLRHVLHAVEGHFIAGFGDGGDDPHKKLELVPGALDDATVFLENEPTTRSNLERVSKLVEGFESPFGLELLSSVHWLCANEEIESEADLVDSVYSWGNRKKKFTPRQIGLALNVLSAKGWVHLAG